MASGFCKNNLGCPAPPCCPNPIPIVCCTPPRNYPCPPKMQYKEVCPPPCPPQPRPVMPVPTCQFLSPLCTVPQPSTRVEVTCFPTSPCCPPSPMCYGVYPRSIPCPPPIVPDVPCKPLYLASLPPRPPCL